MMSTKPQTITLKLHRTPMRTTFWCRQAAAFPVLYPTRPMLIVEALLLVAYLVFAVVRAFMVSYRRDKLVPVAVEEPAKETVSVEADSASDDKDEKEESKA